jgi:hypothetical protein
MRIKRLQLTPHRSVQSIHGRVWRRAPALPRYRSARCGAAEPHVRWAASETIPALPFLSLLSGSTHAEILPSPPWRLRSLEGGALWRRCRLARGSCSGGVSSCRGLESHLRHTGQRRLSCQVSCRPGPTAFEASGGVAFESRGVWRQGRVGRNSDPGLREHRGCSSCRTFSSVRPSHRSAPPGLIRLLPNTYEPPSRQELDLSRPIAALGRDAWLRASVPASHSVFASLGGAGSWTLHPTPIEAHARSRFATRAGRLRLLVLEAHPCPRAGLLMTATSKIRCLQARGRGRVARGRAPRARRCSEREREPVSNQAQRAAGPRRSRPEVSSRSQAHGNDAVFSGSGPRGSRWTAGSRLPLPQFTVARKRWASNA